MVKQSTWTSVDTEYVTAVKAQEVKIQMHKLNALVAKEMVGKQLFKE